MGFVTWILGTALPVVLGWFGYKKGGPSSDEKLGQMEAENADLRNFMVVEGKAADARSSVGDDARSVFDDPDNRRQSPTGTGADSNKS